MPALSHAAPAKSAILLLCLIACTEPTAPVQRADVRLGLELASGARHHGDTVMIAVARDSTTLLRAWQGTVTFDPGALHYLGQVTPAGSIVAVGTETGRLQIAALNPLGLPPRSVLLAFAVERADWRERLSLTIAVAAREADVPLRAAIAAPAEVTDLPGAAGARPLTLDDWMALLGASVHEARPHSPGAYLPNLRFGDATLSGAVNVLDAAYLANVAVGNSALITGTDTPSRDAVVAGNVRPANGAGLGEASDPLAPGVESNGTRVINVLDALAVANETLGIDQAIVGELIPGRAAVPTASALLTGDLIMARTLRKDTVYQVSGRVRVLNGATLTIEAGTRLEGSTLSSQLVITRDGRIDARGTALEPIVLACTAGTTTYCWTGLLVQGHAPVLGADFSSPPARGSGSSGCAQYVTAAGSFGGCDAADSSGVLRYLRVERASIGVQLQGVGSGTVIDFVQTHSGEFGFWIDGGAVRLRHLVVTGNAFSALRWNLSWTGTVQFGLLTGGILAQNTYAATGPFGVPTLYNLTLIPNTQNGIAISGTALAAFRNVATLAGTVALSIADAASCADLGGFLSYEHSLWAGMTVGGDPDPDPTPCAGYASPTVESEWFLDPVNANQSVPTTAALMLDPFNPNLPDFRPAPGSLLLSMPAATPPADGFLDPTATYIGAVPGTSAAGIPWYAGWTTPAATGPVPGGTIAGTVTSSEAGPLAGVTVTAGGVSVLTTIGGGYTIPAPAGVTSVSLGTLPSTCQATGAQQVAVPAAGTVAADFALSCPVPAGAFSVDIDLGNGSAVVHRITRGAASHSLLGSDAVSITVTNVFASPVGAYTPGKVRVWFDLTLSSILNGISLVTPTWPTPPPGESGVFVFPYSATGFTTSGGTVVVLPNSGLITASVDWNGNAAVDQPVPPALPGAGGNPWSWFNDPVCSGGVSGGGDCYRYETYPAIPVLGTTAPRRVGFDLDPSIGQFRAYLVVAADVFQP